MRTAKTYSIAAGCFIIAAIAALVGSQVAVAAVFFVLAVALFARSTRARSA